MKKTTLDISGMHCASCASLITNRLKKESGVSYVNVNLTTEKASVDFDESKTNENKIINIIESLGDYKAKIMSKNINTQDYETKKREKNLKKIRNTFLFSLAFAIPAFLIGMLFMWIGIEVPYSGYILFSPSKP